MTLAEEMPANEAKELSDSFLAEMNIELQQLFVNQFYPDHFQNGTPEEKVLSAMVEDAYPKSLVFDDGNDKKESEISPNVSNLCAHAELARRRRTLNDHYLAELQETIKCQQSVLPRLFVPTIGNKEIETLSELIAAH